jgi:UDP-N-acetylglucosamine--N-acetylmuramyl-(pentapeptide) pyrophosphoryl-undecaprenol N-acetylglucosamine transferase
LEQRLIPDRGYPLLTVERLPFPRKLGSYALKFPAKFLQAIRTCEKYLTEHKIDIVVGFGGYASAPAYLAARKLGIPIVVHEANALPGWANKLGHRFAAATGIAFMQTPLKGATHVGMPLRKEIEVICNGGDVAAARTFFKLDPKTITLLVTGGSLGAKKINEVIDESRSVLSDFAISRAGASTVSEFAASGLPALYVPYPVGNGEQKLNVAELISAGGGLMVADSSFTPDYVAREVVQLMSNTKRLQEMATAAKSHGINDGTQRLLTLVQGVL